MKKICHNVQSRGSRLSYKKGVGIRKRKRHNPEAEIKSLIKLVSISQLHGCLLIQRQQQYVLVFSYALRSPAPIRKQADNTGLFPMMLEKGSAVLCENTAQNTPFNSGRYLSHKSKMQDLLQTTGSLKIHDKIKQHPVLAELGARIIFFFLQRTSEEGKLN